MEFQIKENVIIEGQVREAGEKVTLTDEVIIEDLLNRKLIEKVQSKEEVVDPPAGEKEKTPDDKKKSNK